MAVVEWSPKARMRLREIHAYVAKDSPMNAERLVDRLTRRGETLAAEPRIDRRVPEYLEPRRSRPYRLSNEYRRCDDCLCIQVVSVAKDTKQC